MTNLTIKNYISAGHPCLFIRYCNMDVVEKEVYSILKELNIKGDFGVWKSTTDLLVGNIDDFYDNNKREEGDLLEALNYIFKKEHCENKSVVLILHNIRQLIANFQCIQKIIDCIMYARLVGSHIIIIGPTLEIPEELKNFITIIDFPFPSKEKIREDFIKIIKNYKESMSLPKEKNVLNSLVESAVNSALGLDSIGAENALALSIASTKKIDIEVIQAQKEQEIKKSDVIEFVHTDETIENLGGFNSLKKWLLRRKSVFTSRAVEFGLSYPKGILIVGVPGTGKSLCAKVVASYLELPLVRLDMGSVYQSLVGASEERMRNALKIIDTISPVVLWIDEIGRGMAGSNSGNLDSGVSSRVASTLLTWRQETKAPVFLVATSNEVDSIPAPLLRKGRIDEIWATDIPTNDEIKEILSIHIKKRKRDVNNFNINLLAEKFNGFVGSEIESCIEDAMFYAFEENIDLKDIHILKAIKDTIPQSKRDFVEVEKVRKWIKGRARNVSEKF